MEGNYLQGMDIHECLVRKMAREKPQGMLSIKLTYNNEQGREEGRCG